MLTLFPWGGSWPSGNKLVIALRFFFFNFFLIKYNLPTVTYPHPNPHPRFSLQFCELSHVTEHPAPESRNTRVQRLSDCATLGPGKHLFQNATEMGSYSPQTPASFRLGHVSLYDSPGLAGLCSHSFFKG